MADSGEPHNKAEIPKNFRERLFKCPKCHTIPQLDSVACKRCMTQVSFPNIRLANEQGERCALAGRLTRARTDSIKKNRRKALHELRAAADETVVIFNRFLGPLHTWVMSDNPLFDTFYKQIIAGRSFKDDEYNRYRTSVESAIHPMYYAHVNYAALSLDGMGMAYYGPYTVKLKTDMIKDRASVFEENPFKFFKKHKVVIGTLPPMGYRAAWRNRSSVVVSKLANKLRANRKNDIESMMMGFNRNTADCDYIEVHIYGAIHRDDIQRISGPAPVEPSDKLLWEQVMDKLTNAGVEVEEI